MKTRVSGMDITTTFDDVVVSIRIPKHKAEGIIEDLIKLRCADLDIEIKKHREKRSLNANSYAWQLIHKIADKLSADPIEIYRQFIRESGIAEVLEVSEQAIPMLIESWSSNGEGWQVDILDYARNEGMKIIRLFKGSSVYNTKQMSRFIDNIVQEAKEIGIETMTPAELEGLKIAWRKEGEQKQHQFHVG